MFGPVAWVTRLKIVLTHILFSPPSAFADPPFCRVIGRRDWKTKSTPPAGSAGIAMAEGPPTDCLHEPTTQEDTVSQLTINKGQI